MAVDLISRNNIFKYVIFFDSQSVITANEKVDNPFLAKLLIRLNKLGNRKEIVLCRILNYVGIKENKWADSVAKAVQNGNVEKNFKILYKDLKRSINKYIKQKWQNYWNGYTNNKLFKIQAIIVLGKIGRRNTLQITHRSHFPQPVVFIQR